MNVDRRDSRYLVRVWAADLTMPDFHTDMRVLALDAVVSACVNDMRATVTLLDGTDATASFMREADEKINRR